MDQMMQQQAQQQPQNDPRQWMSTAKDMAQDPEFAQVLQWSREKAPTFVDGFANALLPMVLGFQQSNQVDDDTMLGPILIAMITGALQVADEAGDEEATPEQLEPIRQAIVDRLGRVDAEKESAETGDEQAPNHEQTEAPPELQQEGEQRGRISSMLGGR